jgi:nifR3 family TIM-barrel protein
MAASYENSLSVNSNWGFERKCLYHPVTVGSLTIPGNLFLAPVAGYSDRAFRTVCRENGADFTYTEMVSAEALIRGSSKTTDITRRADNEDIYAVQLFGGDADGMARAAIIMRDSVHPEIIDINAGCPVPKIIKSGAGSALTRDPEKLYRIVLAAHQAVEIPITVKIRSGWDAACMTWKEAAFAAAEAGAAAVTLHARTRAQGYEGRADWSLLAELSALLAGKIPVFGSGDVFSPEDAKAMLEQTGCAAVMFARGAMGNPFIFRSTRDLLQTGTYQSPDFPERIRTGMKELALLADETGETAACREMRKRFCAYTKGIPGSATVRTKIVTATTIAEYQSLFSDLALL